MSFSFYPDGLPYIDSDGSAVLANRTYQANGQLTQISGVNGNVHVRLRQRREGCN